METNQLNEKSGMISSRLFGFTVALALVLGASLGFAFQASAEVVLAPKRVDDSVEKHEYPNSEFGRNPSQPNVTSASRSPSKGRLSRAPAGLVFDENPPTMMKHEMNSHTQTPQTHENQSSMTREKDFSHVEEPAKVVGDHRKGVQEIAVIANELGYFPKTIFVTRDIPVRLFVTGSSPSTLCIMLDSFNIRRQVKSEKVEEINFTPSMPGQYRFYCPVNGMEGTLVVRELNMSRQISSTSSPMKSSGSSPMPGSHH